MSKTSSIALWTLVALAGAGAFAGLALSRGETVSAAWLLTAAVCSYLVAYRFYSRFIASRVFALDERRPTPDGQHVGLVLREHRRPRQHGRGR